MIFSACSSNNAEELFKTAQFEELQNNQEHAVELYREIIKKYPENEFSQKAKVRLTEINK
jgi:TolA-binding protein